MMNLPSKDKNGKSYLSYSAINTFYKDRDQFIKTYILKEPFKGNPYTDFGSKVGEAIEKNDFCLFKKEEVEILSQVERLDLFEHRIKIEYDSFYLVGYIDSASIDLTKIIDYKTGGIGKEFQYSEPDYNQMQYYALGIRQDTGIKVKSAEVNFIRRIGTPKTGLRVASEPVIKIPVDVSENKLKQVYWDTIRIAKEIEIFYESYLRK